MNETEHTPEPWRLDVFEGCYSIEPNVLWLDERMSEDEKRDVRRAIACVNACAGLRTDRLERGRLAEAFDALRRIAALSEDPVARCDAESALQALGVAR